MSSAKVVANTAQLSSDMSRLVDAAIAEIGKAVMGITDEAGGNVQEKWYTQVKRRTGKTGGAIDTALRTQGDKLKGVVLSRDKRTYMVHRPRPLSGDWKFVKSSAEYAEVGRYYQKNGEAPPGYKLAVSKVDGHIYRLRKWVKNPLASDGKNLWKELANKEQKAFVESQAHLIEDALSRAVRLLRNG